ncbi:hypothetical protein CYCME_2397 [Cycloclasticus zancles 78-ME]|uniref:Uncharacterized protein n=1 Tax=Cycloclasticus zancles 78-ME TaxID=1198232 RepID=S5TII3_9GAMM|nr:hypothetical protein CYCME_2397 [Cycloclasticus zancles 78-ME]
MCFSMSLSLTGWARLVLADTPNEFILAGVADIFIIFSG